VIDSDAVGAGLFGPPGPRFLQIPCKFPVSKGILPHADLAFPLADLFAGDPFTPGGPHRHAPAKSATADVRQRPNDSRPAVPAGTVMTAPAPRAAGWGARGARSPAKGMAPERPAARARGTVRPSAMPITMSRTRAEERKCFSICGVTGMRHQKVNAGRGSVEQVLAPEASSKG
jgi:hypothetical protein